MSLWLSSWGLLCALLVGWEFCFNPQLKYPNTMMQAFMSFAVPDLVLSFMNFVVYTVQLVNAKALGDPSGIGGMNETACSAVAFIMYFIVICTFFAPVMGALFTFLKFNSIAKGKANFALPTVAVVGLCICFPLALGIILSAATFTTKADDGQTVLGSYRGLYCFIRRWEPPITWAVLVGYILAVVFTTIFYTMAIFKVAAMVRSSGTSSLKAPKAVMVRGVFLTAAFVTTWIWFAATSGISASGAVLGIQVDYIGAIIINAQPIFDAFVILQMPNVRQALLERQLKKLGISSSSSNSSSSNSSNSSNSSSSY